MNRFQKMCRAGFTACCLGLLLQPTLSQGAPLKVQYYPGVAFSVTFYVAQAEGFFKKHGLDIKTVGVTSGPAALSALSSGSVEIGTVNPDLLIAARQRGLNFKAICAASGPYFDLVGTSGFVPKPYPEIMKQVAGKRVGVNALGSGGQFFMEAMLEGAGLPKDGVTFVPVGTLGAIAAMQNKRIDLYMSFEPVTTILTQSAGGKLLWSLADAAGPQALTKLRVGIVWIAQADALEKHPSQYLAFNQALEEAKSFIENPANADKAANDVVKFSGVNTKELIGGDNTLREVVKNKLLRADAITRFDREDADRWLAYMRQYQSGMLKASNAKTSDQVIAKQAVWANSCQ